MHEVHMHAQRHYIINKEIVKEEGRKESEAPSPPPSLSLQWIRVSIRHTKGG